MSTPQTAQDRAAGTTASGAFVDFQGERYYRLTDHDTMPPFLMSIVSDSDHWLFISSNGALTCGRRSPDHALFPYYPDDRIHDAYHHTGCKTVMHVHHRDESVLWEPFSSDRCGSDMSRSLYKSSCGNRIIFEETNHRLGLRFWYEWMSSERFGFVRRATLENIGEKKVEVDLLDGIQNVLPSGVSRRFQLEYSTLVDGYKRTELDSNTGLALFRLTSIPVDRAEPSEALRANVAWSHGLEDATILLSSSQVEDFRRGEPVYPESDIHGIRGAYLLNQRLALEPGDPRSWRIAADVDLDSAQVRSLLSVLREQTDLDVLIDEDVQRGSQNLSRIVCSADGLQLTANEPSCWHHFSSTLFNTMRGGVPEDNYWVRRSDFEGFLCNANRLVSQCQADFVKDLPETIKISELLILASKQNDPDLERLAHEYLPLTFGRRHGDPSRPWNNFDIKVKDAQGRPVVHYEGNWRDIFQNWEALSSSFPGLTRSMLFKFLDSSTADGYNPYRISETGYEWELLDQHDSWSYIGYWGDHQVVYLLKLLEHAVEHDPDALQSLLSRRVFTFANVPYRIRSYEEIIRDPRNTIIFDKEEHRKTIARAKELGFDGKALRTRTGEIARASLAEKLLIVILAKLSNYVPEAGIWLNTQRPEWNDANNALVGSGASMVTLYQLRRLLTFLRELFDSAGSTTIDISSEVGALFRDVSHALVTGDPAPKSDGQRRTVLDMLGRAASEYRRALYAGGLSGERISIAVQDVHELLDVALRHVEHSIRSNRRSDGLYHSYNLLRFDDASVGIRRLKEMLEGQVAVLESGALNPCEALELLNALSKSKLYRADQQSYMLYPSSRLPKFLEKNNVPAAEVESSQLLAAMLQSQDFRIVVPDLEGGYHFNADFRNADILKRTLAELRDGNLASLAEAEEEQILELYEKVFDHQSFTGRSGTLYKYEGLGCIYWHMVAKLLLAVQNVIRDASNSGVDPAVIAALRNHYKDIRRGLGTHKPPSLFGAIPFDPHSHTPDFAGAQQPGMSGQAKEDFLSRMGEMSVDVRDGVLAFNPELLAEDEFLTRPEEFTYWDCEQTQKSIQVPTGALVFTICQVPTVLHKDGPAQIEVVLKDGTTEKVPGLSLSKSTSEMIFGRTGQIQSLRVFLHLY